MLNSYRLYLVYIMLSDVPCIYHVLSAVFIVYTLYSAMLSIVQLMSVPCNLFILNLCSLLCAAFTLVYVIMCLASMYLCLCADRSLSLSLSLALSVSLSEGTVVDEHCSA